jgi:hypothetical protein
VELKICFSLAAATSFDVRGPFDDAPVAPPGRRAHADRRPREASQRKPSNCVRSPAGQTPRLKVLAVDERDATVDLVAHLAELDGRKAHLGEGPGRLYKYCRDVLGYSEGAAWNRAATAGAVRMYPVLLVGSPMAR